MSNLFNKIKEYVNAGWVLEQKHPTEELYIYNYSKSCTLENKWDEVTMSCRGLILNKAGEIIARPFKKFFNYHELDPAEIPDLPYEIYKKMDGSLGISYWIKDKFFIATRGSFVSEQSIKANEILCERYYKKIYNLSHNKTYLFEIISKPSKIVLNYDYEDIILLAMVDIQTGIESYIYKQKVFKTVELVDWPSKDFIALRDLNIPNEEGYVIKYTNGFRFKLKFQDYVRLHAVITNCSNKAIWVALKDKVSLEEYLTNVPDEFYNWVIKTRDEFLESYNKIYNKHLNLLNSLPLENKTLKEISLLLESQPKEYNFHILIDLYRGAFDYVHRYIWKSLKPTYEKPYIIE